MRAIQTSRFNPAEMWLYGMLIFFPIAILLEFFHAAPASIFVVSSLAIIPLAGLMGQATENLAEKLGAGIGGLLNATFGNAAEHSTAILMAVRNKMDLSLNIAVGSSIQVALFVAPILVFMSYGMGNPLDLHFSPFEVLAVTISMLVVNLVAQDGESHWMEGVLLIAVYLILGMAFYFLPG